MIVPRNDITRWKLPRYHQSLLTPTGGYLWSDELFKIRLVYNGRRYLKQRIRPGLIKFNTSSLVVRPRRHRRGMKKVKKKSTRKL